MKKGLLLYTKENFNLNKTYADWLIQEGKKINLLIETVILDENNEFLIAENNDIDFVINRTRNYNLSLQFELNQIRVFNKSDITLYGNNKLSGFNLAKSLNIPFSDIFLKPNDKINCIKKPNYGHGGKDIFKGDFGTDLINPDIIYQQFVENTKGDVRFWIINNKIEHAVIRSNPNSFLSNYSLGGDFSLFSYSNEQEKIVFRFFEKIHIDYAGIDFILTEDGNFIFNEIEDVVGSRMLTELGINDTTTKFLNYIKSSI